MNKSRYKKIHNRRICNFTPQKNESDLKIPVRAILKRDEEKEIEEWDEQFISGWGCPDCDHPPDLCVCGFRSGRLNL